MGVEGKKAPPLPAPTETESLSTPTELTTDVSKAPQDEKSSFSLPDDGTPVTIKTRGHKPNRSQTSLLIEYFEGGKGPASPEAESSGKQRRPSVRVRLTPSKNRGKNDHIQITETRSTRKASSTRRTDSPTASRSELEVGDLEDARSMNSYASATEESNVSRQPVEVEIISGHGRRRERKVSSPLIPAADSKTSSYAPPNMSDISAIPTDSFLDGSGGATTLSHNERSSKSPGHGEALAAGALGAVAGAIAADKMNRKPRSESHDRKIIEKAVEKASKPERRHKSKSRTSSLSEKDIESKASPRRRSKGSHKDSVVSAADSSVLSSQMTPSHRSYDSYSSSKVSINNPKLLETVEDAIRRLILPELDAIKREHSKRETRRSKDRESLSSLTSLSKEDLAINNKRRSADTTHSTKSRGREARNDISPDHSIEETSVIEGHEDEYPTPRRTHDRLGDAALLGEAAVAGAAIANAVRDRSRGDDDRRRRRRRAKTPERGRAVENFEETEHDVVPPMPLSSEINPSEVTRASIMSAETDRPHSASEETHVKEVSRGTFAGDGLRNTPTPTRTPVQTMQSLGTQHANISHGDLRALPRKSLDEYDEYDESEVSQPSQRYPHPPDEYDDEYDEAGHLAEPGMYEEPGMEQNFFGTQEVPPPLRYVPYQQERRGLSPIQSVSGYTEGESEAHHHRRDSRATHSEFSSPDKSPYHDIAGRSTSSIPSNMRSREFGDADSLRSSGNYGNYDHEDGISTKQAVRGVGANAELIEPPMGTESHVASLIDGSVFEPSVVSERQDYRDSQLSYEGDGHHESQLSYGEEQMRDSELPYEAGAKRNSQLSFEEGAREHLSRGMSPPGQLSGAVHHDSLENRNTATSLSQPSESNESPEYEEYDLDEYGRKVPATSTSRHGPSASEAAAVAAITSAALGRAARTMQAKHVEHASPSHEAISGPRQQATVGVARNTSFKERAAKDGYQPNVTPRHSVDRLSDFERPKMGATGLPDMSDPLPEIGWGIEDGHRTPSIANEPAVVENKHQDHDEWHGEELTPSQAKAFEDRAATPKAIDRENGRGLGLPEAAAVAALTTAGVLAATHSRQPSQEQPDEMYRTSGERKRDTIVTNPYEGASPIANLPGVEGNMLSSGGLHGAYRDGFSIGSPGIAQGGDEGYISAPPNEPRDGLVSKGKGVGFVDQPGLAGTTDDPFYAPMPKHVRHLSGLSQGVGSPLYDPASGSGMDRIESQDIIHLMEHLMVRDAQRNARDTEMLVTLVRSAAEMRNSFNDMKRLLADTEDQIIGEVKDNTEKTVQRHLGGPRPLPGSTASRSIQGGSQSGTIDDLPAKKRNFLRRALKGLGAKGTNDLGRIEEMLMQLLTEVDVLKHQTAPGGGTTASAQNLLDNFQAEISYEQDRGYEPEGNAGTSTASHASQSGQFSIPQSRATSKTGYERKFSDHRISTVPEDNEEEIDNQPTNRPPADDYEYANPDYRGLIDAEPPRGGSVPLGTPPPAAAQAGQASLSNDNTPHTDASKKHKSRGSSSFFPKISRWSETTTSSLGKVFRSSAGGSSRKLEQPEEFLQHPPSRSGSDLQDYDQYPDVHAYDDDRLEEYVGQASGANATQQLNAPARQLYNNDLPLPTYSTPEDPKYKAHRDSLNLQHPQPRPGQTERFRAALESGAQIYNTPMSPRSADWAGSATSLNRFPAQNTQRYSDQSAAQEYGGAWTAENNAASPAANQGPPRPPKEPLNANTPPRNDRVSKLQKKSGNPYQSPESGYGATQPPSAYHSVSPRYENRNLGSALGTPARRPSGPRAMTPTKDKERFNTSRGSDGGDSVRSATAEMNEMASPSGQSARDDRRRKRDTFGTVASQESETF